MAKLNKQPERWLTQEEFDSLDPTTIPQGTVINVVGVVYHRYKIEIDTGNMYGKLSCFIDTVANNLTELVNIIIEQKVLQGTILMPPNNEWMNTQDYYGSVVCYISTVAVNGKTLTISGELLALSVMIGSSNVNYYNSPFSGTATVTQLW